MARVGLGTPVSASAERYELLVYARCVEHAYAPARWAEQHYNGCTVTVQLGFV